MTAATTPETCVVLGGGGHASVVLDAVLAAGRYTPVAIVDANPALSGGTVLGIPVIGGDEALAPLAAAGAVRHFVMGIGCVAPGPIRERLYRMAISVGLLPLTVIHPSAYVSRWASLGAGTVVLAASVVNAGARIGVNAIVNTGAIVEHDCQIGDHAHIATGAKLAGNVRVGAGSVIGAGAVVRQGIAIGTDAMVGAGAVVVRAVADGTVVAGVPAQVL